MLWPNTPDYLLSEKTREVSVSQSGVTEGSVLTDYTVSLCE